MTWQSVWDGNWDGIWFGDEPPIGFIRGAANFAFSATATLIGDESPTGFIQGAANIAISATATLTATTGESRDFVGGMGSIHRDGGVRRRVPMPRIAPYWEREHENDAVLIAVGIF